VDSKLETGMRVYFLCAVSVSSVSLWCEQLLNHGDTENTEAAQRNPLDVGRYEAGTFGAECRGVTRHRDGRADDGNNKLELITSYAD